MSSSLESELKSARRVAIGFFVVTSMGEACLFPYLTLHFKHLGLSASQVGIIRVLQTFLTLCSIVVWVQCATRFHLQRFVIVASLLISATAYLAISVIPPLKSSPYLLICPYNSDAQNPSMNETTWPTLVVKIDDSSSFNQQVDDQKTDVFQTENGEKRGENPVANPDETQQWKPQRKNGYKKLYKHESPYFNQKKFEREFQSNRKEKSDKSQDVAEISIIFDKLRSLPENRAADLDRSEEWRQGDADLNNNNNNNNNNAYYEEDGEEDQTVERTLKKSEVSKRQSDQKLMLEGPWYRLNENDINEQINQKNCPNCYGIANDDNNDDHVIKSRKLLHCAHKHKLWKHREDDNSFQENNHGETLKHPEWKKRRRNDVIEEEQSNDYNYGKHFSYGLRKKRNRRRAIAEVKNPLPSSTDMSYDTLDYSSISTESSVVIETQSSTDPRRVFVFVLIAVVIGSGFGSPAVTTADQAWYGYLEDLDLSEKYGNHQSVCMVLAAIAAMVTSTVVAETKCRLWDHVDHYVLHFYVYGILLGIALLLAMCFPMVSSKFSLALRQTTRVAECQLLCVDISLVLVTVTALLTGLCSSCLSDFLLWTAEDLGGNELYFGGIIAMGFAQEIFAPNLSRYLLRKLKLYSVLSLSMLVLSLRLFYFSFAWTPWSLLFGQLAHIGSAVAVPVITSAYVSRTSDLSSSRAIRTIVVPVLDLMGRTVGSGLAGFAFEFLSPSVMYRVAGGCALAWSIILFVSYKLMLNTAKPYAQLIYAQEMLGSSVGDSETDEDWLDDAMKKSDSITKA